MYKQITAFPQYETDGKNVKSKHTGKIIKPKKGTGGKYYLLNKQGERKLVLPRVIFGELFDRPVYKIGDKVSFDGWKGVIARFTYRGEKSYMKVKCSDGNYHFKRIY